MPPSQRRRRQVEDEDSEEESRHPRQRRSREESHENNASENEAVDAAVSAEDQLAKKLVRYALACEFSRTPIRRDGIKERALKSGSQVKTSSGVFVLSTTLPATYRTPSIIAPSKAPSIETEASYIGFYTMIITIILASGGELSEQKLRRHLNRLNAEANVASEKTEDVLKRMQAQGYVVRKVQKNAATQAQDGSEDITWLVGPRGLEEVGIGGAAGLVRAVYGEQADADLEKKIKATFGIPSATDGEGDVDMSQAPEAGPSY
ncbi:hypothetical protein CTA2_11259 [Colletotrichum tanaceti]|uniref:MAGE domain-containing protein n=1 Tax=Colletotrichum tanaceti TaxID=1306861 RepID=A0A4U6XEW4_9PEZI|nr:hypothetical protein CTA2_11259 [Colletotrichum tanaceti]TKW54388.1 hypothetical protein CTA1_4038 [Colletotrichum tanaceti]